MPPKHRDSPKRLVYERHGYSFGGPWVILPMIIALPLLTWSMGFLCNDVSGCPVPSLLHPSQLTLDKLKEETGWAGWSSLFNCEAFALTVGYYLLSLFLYAIIPANEVSGTMLRYGGRLRYRFNAFYSALATLAGLAAYTAYHGIEDAPLWTFIWENYIPIMTSNIILSIIFATYTYLKSFGVRPPGNPERRELASHGLTGNMIHDWFMGRELNSRIKIPLIPEVDIKTWMELRPGMLLWMILNATFVIHQYRTYHYISFSMLFSVGTQTLYVIDSIFMEPAILTTIDVIVDGFGFMLSFGDLVWVPFIFSLQPRYLAVHPVTLTYPQIALIFATEALGYYIFRASNNEKNIFRNNPEDPRVAHLEYLETRSGSRLLVSGWWGRARHINYCGDWIQSWAYCLPTGLAGYEIVRSAGGGTSVEVGEARYWGMVVTYFYLAYFAVLLVHRERRDDAKCRNKYGADWEEYCRRVPYRIIPYVY
ncbi:ERG4/ERG24 ergosterol biosynthesis protein [Eremomyces bilateralis CBS 781.70]|uniref:Delta(14)-sterol reductase n=1 Tax=Eremomyces bilateralis CBS 781.70 TaxID=1392243 RepID=A0A6G1GEB6_9PEZI|nr:ERG4/ERG24 ergosterol biosynthesis protein [Eremomyces bilateralis CBS 781.70]KAF1816437.1 ERG4/ERG24 ergosterol biosynthesis protein [Eremomyces bilateralis CBS 781.70]